MTRLRSDSRAGRVVSSARRTFVTLGLVGAVLTGCATAPPEEPEVKDLTPVQQQEISLRTLELAELAINDGRIDDAKRLLERAVLVAPEDDRVKILLAELQLASGSLEVAISAFEELLGSPVVGPVALQGKGLALYLSGETEEGVAVLRSAVEQDPSLWRAWNALGTNEDLEGRWARAENDYRAALAANPDSPSVLSNLGFSMIMQERPQDAMEYLNRALTIRPDLKIAQANMRLALAWMGKYASATAGTVLNERSRNLNNAGFVALLRGDFPKAESLFLQAMEADASFNRIAWKNLEYLRQLREIERADAVEGSRE